MQQFPTEILSPSDRLFFGVGEVDWLIEQELIQENDDASKVG